MKKFRTTLFNGYQKNAVDDYLEDLMREMDELREDALKGQSIDRFRAQLEEIRRENEQLQEQLKEQSRRLEAENDQRQQLISEHEKQLREEKQQLADMDRQLKDRDRQLAEKEQQIHQLQQREDTLKAEQQRFSSLNDQYAETEEKLKRYENDYSSFMDLMVNMKTQAKQIVTDAQADAEEILLMAKKDADTITSSARSDAEKITNQAKISALDYRQNVEKELKKKQDEESLKFQLARFKIAGYLESLNRSQNKLIEVYEEFGSLVGQLPLRLGDVFSEEPFEPLDSPETKEADRSEPDSSAK